MARLNSNPYARDELLTQLGSGGRVGQPGRAGGIANTVGDVAATAAGTVGKQAAPIAGRSLPSALGPGVAPAGSAPKPGVGGLGTAGIGIAGEVLGGLLETKEQQATPKGGEFGNYIDQYDRRHEGSGGGVASSASKWGGRGAQIGSVIPGVGTMVGLGAGALGGALGSLFTKNSPTANTDFRNEDAAAAIASIYKNELGRDASPEEVAGWLQGQGSKPGDRWVGQDGMMSVLSQIRNSPEAAQFKAGGAQPAAAGGAEPVARAGDGRVTYPEQAAEREAFLAQLGGGGGFLDPKAAAGGLQLRDPGAGPAAASAGGATTGAVPAGWDAAKVASGHQSPKYAAREPLIALSSQLQGIQGEAERKAAAQDAITAMIPQLEAAGAKVLEVKNEKALIDANDGKGPLWIDMIQDIEGKAAPQWIEPDAGGGAEAGAQATGAGLTADATAPESDVMAQILAEIKKIQGGGADRGDVLQQLGA